MTIDTRIKDLFFSETIAKARALSPRAFSPEFNALGRVLRDKVLANFQTETDPFGNAWAPLSRRTIAEKVKHGSNTPFAILQDTGLMMHSFQYRALVNGVRLFNTREFDNGEDASIHQEGGISDGSVIPARPMLPDQGEWPDDWLIAANDAIAAGIDRLFT